MTELWLDVRESLEVERLIRGFRDWLVIVAFLLGGIGLLFPSGNMPPLWRVISVAGLEELVYRVLIQSQFERLIPWKRGSFTIGMFVTSALFALSHLPTHTPLMAVLTFFPSLVFGILWTRHHSFWLCAAVHFWYNFLFFLKGADTLFSF